MAKEQEQDFDMSLFGEDLELNLDNTPEQEEEEEQEEETNTLGENQNDSEEVTEEEDQEEGNDPEEESDEESEDSEDSDVDSDNDSPDTLYSSFASVLSEKGLLPSLDLENKEIKSVDDLVESIKNEIDTQSKSYLVSKIGEDGYEALQKGISLAEYQQHQETISSLDNITDNVIEEDLELAKKIVLQDYISQGMDEKRANRILKKSIDLGDDIVIEDAKESLQSLKQLESIRLEKVAEQNQAQAKQQQDLQDKIDNDLKNTIYNKDEYIKGFGVNKAIKDRVYESITKVVGESPEGVAENKLMKQRRESPIEFDTKLYYIYEITNGFSDFSKLVSKSESKAISNLEKNLRKNKFESQGSPSYMDDPESYGGIGSELVL